MVTLKPHAALLASPGMGHLIPTLELAKRLTTHHGFDVTVFVVTTSDSDSTATKSHLFKQTSNLNNINIIVTPPVDVSDKIDPKNPSLGLQIVLTMIESIHFIKSQILSMKINPPSVLIVDLFGTIALPMARDLHMSSYVFFATNAWFTAVNLYLPFITEEAFFKHVNFHEPLLIPGCEPVRFEDTLETFVEPFGPIHQGYVDATREILLVDGILMNTWQDLEPRAVKAVTENGVIGRFFQGKVYPVGPLVRTVEPEEKKKDLNHGFQNRSDNQPGEDTDSCFFDLTEIQPEFNRFKDILSWLDRQLVDSVIYLSFGSGGTMSENQMRELAYGLELSQQRFVWVVRRPSEDDACAAFFDRGGNESTVLDYLPEGFLKRTKDVGICVPMWAPQAEILKHHAIGGFVTHCGWNSVLESVLNGVPMIAWPLYAEQKMNATILSEEIGVAVKVKAAVEGGVVCREEIAEVIRRVMVDEEGKDMRVKVKEYKVSGEKALSLFGTSHKSLCEMAKECELHLHRNFETQARGN